MQGEAQNKQGHDKYHWQCPCSLVIIDKIILLN
jgi:hypothetical protein